METLAKHFAVGRYPNNLAFRVNRTVPSDIWTQNVRGRLFPLVEMNGIVDVAEYFAGIPPANPAAAYLVKKQVVHGYIEFGNIVSIMYDTHFVFPSLGREAPASFFGWYRFTNDHLIEQFDIQQVGSIRHAREMGLDIDNPAHRERSIQGICQMHNTYCNGTNTQFGPGECVTFLRQLPFGTPDWVRANTTYCRTIHSQMVYSRPDVHCPHIGRDGGGMCVDVPFSDYREFRDGFAEPFTPQNSNFEIPMTFENA
jgi:hypothetical protein